jgi:WD40 repeat protein
MLTGGRAFQGPSSVDIMSAILKEDVEISESDARFPPSLARIVRRCLEKSPNERFESARDLAFALQAVSPSPGPMGASSAQPAVPTPQFRRRALWVIAALAAAAMLGGIYYLGGRQTTPVSLHFQRKNFPSGYVTSARFTNDGQTIIYSAAWGQKPNQLYSTRRESSESHAFDVGDATILAVSQRGEMALLLNSHYVGWEPGIGTLAEAPILGGAPHEISENVRWAGFNPDGSALAVVRKNGDHYRVEYPLGTVLLDTSETIDRIHVLPNDEGVWVRAGARTILTLDRRGSRRVLFSEPSGNIWPAEFPGRREIWLTTIDGNGNSTLIAVPFSGRQRKIADLTGSLQLFDISKDGQMLLQGIDERTELVYRGPGDTADRDMSWLGRSIAEDISADGRVILFNDAPSEKYATYIRRRDESAPVRLGDAYGTSLSSDGRTVAGMATYPGRLLLLPVGAGQIRQPATGNVKTVMWVKWLPDNKRVLYLGSEPGKGARYYVQDIASDVSRAISLEGVSVLGSFPVSPDGKWVALTDPDGKISRYPIDGGPPQALTTGAAGDAPSAWSADGRFLYHYLLKRPPTTIRRLDLTTARDEDWRPLVPPNLTGALFIAPVAITPDGQSYAYSIRRRLTQFYIADTLKEAFR